MLKFKNMSKVREKAIQAAPAKEITADFAINNNAKALHPDYQRLTVSKIINHPGAEAKTFVFESADGAPLAYFRAGQYLSLKMKIGGSVLSRPYSISSAPKDALAGRYELTVRANPGGFAADWLLEEAKVGDTFYASATSTMKSSGIPKTSWLWPAAAASPRFSPWPAPSPTERRISG